MSKNNIKAKKNAYHQPNNGHLSTELQKVHSLKAHTWRNNLKQNNYDTLPVFSLFISWQSGFCTVWCLVHKCTSSYALRRCESMRHNLYGTVQALHNKNRIEHTRLPVSCHTRPLCCSVNSLCCARVLACISCTRILQTFRAILLLPSMQNIFDNYNKPIIETSR